MPPESRIPSGPLEDKWTDYKSKVKLVSPANKRKHNIIIVGSGLAGASAASSLGELGYNIKCFCIQDSPRRAHSVAAQGGINAAKNYQNDGDSIWRLFYDTIKGGDYRSREANVYRLAEISANIIDHCAAQGVPFAREYGGTLANRSFGGVQVSRTFYARGQTGQQLLLGAYSSLMRQIDTGNVVMYPKREMLDLVVVNDRARGITCRNLATGEIESHTADAVILATGGYGNIYYLSTNGKNSNVTAAWRCYKKGASFANPCFTQIHPTCIPVSGHYQSKLTLMSESLRNDGRAWVPKDKNDKRHPNDIPDEERDYYLERKYPAFGNLVPRDIASRAAKAVCDEGRGVNKQGKAVYLDFASAIERLGVDTIKDRYGNLFDMYEKITGDNPYKQPMKIYPAVHYCMGGLWVDYGLMSNLKGLFVIGEANFSDHGANRLGASALMQGLADGYFVIPYTLGEYLAGAQLESIDENNDEFKGSVDYVSKRINKMLSINGTKTVNEFHRELGSLIWEYVGMSRSKEGLEYVLKEISKLREEFWSNLRIPGKADYFNKYLEMAGRVADFLELGEVMAMDAMLRNESCGGHFREEYQTQDGEALRDDENYSYVSLWDYNEAGRPLSGKENLKFEFVKPTTRSYK